LNIDERHIIISNRKIIMQEIEALVLNKFNLYESIKKDGISLIKRDRIRVVEQDKFLILKGGHHRVAISKILGLDYVPVYIEVANVKS
jgi:ParB-like chromosome segregation protein Spo0J